MKPSFSYKLTKNVLGCINDYELIRHGDLCIAGLSGGADSTCLVLLLNEIKKQLGFELHAVHVNHGIRGEAAAHDEEFSKKLCEELDIPYKSYFVDVPALAKEKGLTLEEAGRNARYECFNAYAEELRSKISELSVADKSNQGNAETNIIIALAHHQSDQAETVIFNMIRGSGLKGMGGTDVKSKRGSLTVIRPLLFISKEDILKYLKNENREFCTDESNFSNDYSRNMLRNTVIPALNVVQPKSVEHICKTASELREAEAFVQKYTLKLFETAVRQEDKGTYIINIKKVKDEEPIVVRYLIIHVLKQLVSTYKDITRTHIEDIYSLIGKGKGKHIMLPFGLSATRVKDGIYIKREL